MLVDTNVLLYAAQHECPEHEACRRFLDGCLSRPSAWFTTWPILYEFLRVATHPAATRSPWPTPHAWKFVEGFLSAPGLRLLVETERHAEMVSMTLREIPALRGSIMHDAHTAILMREHGVRRIVTRDTGFHRFPFLEVVDPLAVRYGEPEGPGDLSVRERARRGRASGRGRARAKA